MKSIKFLKLLALVLAQHLLSQPCNPAWTPPVAICNNGGNINLNTLLNAGSTTGGIWSGTGVVGSAFDPTGLSGPFSITYSTNQSGCIGGNPNPESHIINVIDPPVVVWNPPAAYCSNLGILDLNTLLDPATPATGTWSGRNVTGSLFDPTGIIGDVTLTYRASNTSCSASESHTITIVKIADPIFTLPAILCGNSTYNLDLFLNHEAPTNGTWSGTNVTRDSLIPTYSSTSGSITYTYTISGCVGTQTTNFNTQGTEDPHFTLPDVICENTTPIDLNTLLDAGATTGGVWSGAGIAFGGHVFDPTGLSNRLEITYTVGTNPCKASHKEQFILKPRTPKPTIPNYNLFTCVNLPISISANGSNLVWHSTSRLFDSIFVGNPLDTIFSKAGQETLYVRSHTIPECPSEHLEIFVEVDSMATSFHYDNITIDIPQQVDFINTTEYQLLCKWYFNDSLTFRGQGNFDSTFTQKDTIIIKLVCENLNGCADSTYDTLIIGAGEPTLFMPNAFSPNEDEYNKVWKAYALNIERFEATIINRESHIIKELKGIEDFWDGTYKGEVQPAGVYPIFYRYKLEGQKLKEGKSFIILVR